MFEVFIQPSWSSMTISGQVFDHVSKIRNKAAVKWLEMPILHMWSWTITHLIIYWFINDAEFIKTVSLQVKKKRCVSFLSKSRHLSLFWTVWRLRMQRLRIIITDITIVPQVSLMLSHNLANRSNMQELYEEKCTQLHRFKCFLTNINYTFSFVYFKDISQISLVRHWKKKGFTWVNYILLCLFHLGHGITQAQYKYIII